MHKAYSPVRKHSFLKKLIYICSINGLEYWSSRCRNCISTWWSQRRKLHVTIGRLTMWVQTIHQSMEQQSSGCPDNHGLQKEPKWIWLCKKKTKKCTGYLNKARELCHDYRKNELMKKEEMEDKKFCKSSVTQIIGNKRCLQIG